MPDDWYKPNRPPAPPRVPKPGELLFEFYRESDHSRWRCELRDHGGHGVEAQFFKNEEIFVAQAFHPRLDPTRTPRAMAIAWAEQEQLAIAAYRPSEDG
jgi:hypothetical protein